MSTPPVEAIDPVEALPRQRRRRSSRVRAGEGGTHSFGSAFADAVDSEELCTAEHAAENLEALGDDEEGEQRSTAELDVVRDVARRHAMAIAARVAPAPYRGWIRYCGLPSAISQLWRRVSPSGRIVTWWSNAVSCKARWVCPSCSAAHGRKAEKEIATSIRSWRARGEDHVAHFMTFTIRHTREHSLTDSLAVVRSAFDKLRRSKAWQRLQRSGGIAGWVRVIEFTYSEVNGWHVHVHVLALCRDLATFQDAWDLPTDDAGRLGLTATWARAVDAAAEARGVRGIYADPKRQHMREADPEDAAAIACYITKDGQSRWQAATEVARGDLKRARGKGMTPQQLMLAAGDGDHRAKLLFHDYVAAVKGLQRYSESLLDGKPLHATLAEEDAARRRIERATTLGVGDSDRARQNRIDLDAQQRARKDFSRDEQQEMNERDLELSRQRDRYHGPIASFAELAAQRKAEGHVEGSSVRSQAVYTDRDQLAALEAAVRSGDDPARSQQVAYDFAKAHDMPLTVDDPDRRRSRRVPRSSARPDSYVREVAEYHEMRAEVEAQLAAKVAAGADQAAADAALDRWDEAIPYPTRPPSFEIRLRRGEAGRRRFEKKLERRRRERQAEKEAGGA